MSSKTKTKDTPSSSNNASANESTIDNLDTSISAKEAPYVRNLIHVFNQILFDCRAQIMQRVEEQNAKDVMNLFQRFFLYNITIFIWLII